MRAAIASARRLRGHPVHPDKLKHLIDLLHHARRRLGTGEAFDRETLSELVATLDAAVVDQTT